MKLICISDTHGDHDQVQLPDGDVLIHAGDVTGHGTERETQQFMQWLGSQMHPHKICIAGNHDTFMEAEPETTRRFAQESGVILLNDSGCEVEGVSFWGSPITPRFFTWSFMRDPGAPIEAHWDLIPSHTDVLITHGPPYGILDQVRRGEFAKEHAGCTSLLEAIRRVQPAVHLFGHIHEEHGAKKVAGVAHFNVSTMNDGYLISNAPVVIDLSAYITGE